MAQSSPRKGKAQGHQHQRSDSSDFAERSSSRGGGGGQRRRASYEDEADDEDYPYEDDEDEEEDEDGIIELGMPLTYDRFLASHVLSLLPAFSLLLALGLFAWEAPCVLTDVGESTQEESRSLCRRMASEGSSITAFALGLVGWSASFAARHAVEKLVGWAASGVRLVLKRPTGTLEGGAKQEQEGAGEGVLETIVFVAIRTVWLELLRMMSILMAFSVILARLARLRARVQSGDAHSEGMLSPWDLDWYDPRFAASLWVALGWATTEFVVTSTQMFDRLTLYRSAFDQPHDVETDVEAALVSRPDANAAVDSEEEEYIQSPIKTSFNVASAAMKRSAYASDLESSSSGNESGATVTARSSANNHHKVPGELAGNGHQQQQQQQLRKVTPEETLSKARAEARRTFLSSRRITTPSYGSIDAVASSPASPRQTEEEELNALQTRLFNSLDRLIIAKKRSDLESSLGVPLPDVPLVLCSLWRIDGFLWNLGSTLLLSASLTLAQGPLSSASSPLPDPFVPLHKIATTLSCLILLHGTFTCFWTLALPRLGFAVVTYTSLLAGLGLVASALARWGLLV